MFVLPLLNYLICVECLNFSQKILELSMSPTMSDDKAISLCINYSETIFIESISPHFFSIIRSLRPVKRVLDKLGKQPLIVLPEY